jgi:hypothetical protein
MAAIEHKRHEPADHNYGEADNYGEDDTNPHSNGAGHT